MAAALGEARPDISYEPDLQKHEQRTAARLQADPSLPNTPLPPGFPSSMDTSVLYFDENSFQSENEYTYNLTDKELKEIKKAVQYFAELQIPYGFLSKDNFPLPTLGPTLENAIASEIYDGRGFVVLRGIPVDDYSYNGNVLLQAGLSLYVGSKRGKQHPDNSRVVAHVVDLTNEFDKEKIGTNQYTANHQCFHTDFAEAISLYNLQSAANGGTSRFASIAKIYNVLASTRPDLIKVLASDWAIDGASKEASFSQRPLLYYHDKKLFFQYTRRIFAGLGAFQRSAEIPPLTEAQAEAMDTVEFLARKHSVPTNLRKGDIQLVNSFGLLHSRDAFRDTPTHKRDALRIWIRNEKLVPTVPQQWEDQWKTLYYSLKPEEEDFALTGSDYDYRSVLFGVEWVE